MQLLLACVGELRPRGVTVDMPDRYQRADALQASLGRRGYTIQQMKYLCAEFGDPTSRIRRAIIALKQAPDCDRSWKNQ